MKRSDLVHNGPWLLLIIAGVGVESWAVRHDPDATLTRFTRRILRPRSTPGAFATWMILGWVGHHLTETDKNIKPD